MDIASIGAPSQFYFIFIEYIYVYIYLRRWEPPSIFFRIVDLDVGVRFCSSTNGCTTLFSEELKPRNLFDGTVELLISLKKDMFEQHVLPGYLGGGTGVVPTK